MGHMLGRFTHLQELIQMDISQIPLPRVTPDTEYFWEGCRRHELLLAECNACNRVHLPPGPVCPFCFSDELGWRKASGRGRVSAWTVVHKEWFAAFKDDLPYNAAQIELEEGPRLTANIIGVDNDKLSVGMAVEVVFDDVTEDVTLPRFSPT